MVAKTLSRVLALLVVFPAAALALGLGDIHLSSTLNAPLDAEIEIVGAAPDEMQGMRAQIASRETFGRYKLDYPAFASGITVQPVHGADGRDLIKLHSVEAITEPFVTLLIEVNWSRGRLVREYTMLLDPPVYTPGQTAAAAVAAPQAGETAREGTIARHESQSTSPAPVERPTPTTTTMTPAPSPASGTTSAGASRTVRRGESLSMIAREAAHGESQNTRRWMVAIYRGNQDAFEGNMNLLRAGSVLRIPDSSTLSGIGPGEASAEIHRQYAAWRGAAPAHSRAPSEPGHLRLVTPSAQPGSNASTQNGASAAADAALKAHVQELESQLQESKRLLDVRNAELAQLQAKLAGHGTPEAGKPSVPAAPPVSETPATPSPSANTEIPAPAAAPTEEAAPAATPQAAAPSPPPSPVKLVPKAQKPVVPQSSIFDTVKDLWWVIAVVIAGIAVLLGLRAWRARRESEFDNSLGRLASAGPNLGPDTSGDTASLRAVGAAEPNFLVEESGSHERPRFSSDQGAPAHVASDDTISSDTAINLDQGDPLAEADFHMAYGLYDQAADLVRIAIGREPDRRDLRLKLLEVFFVWGNKEQFLSTARELAQTRDQAAPGEWEKIVIMGKQLAPEDELFASGVSGAAAAGVDLDLEGGQSRVDFDLLGEPIPEGELDQGVDLDIGSALGDRDPTAESPSRTTDAHLALHDTDLADAGSATTREMAPQIQAEPEPLMPDFGLDTMEAPTVEQPAMESQGNPTIRQKVDVALRQQGGAEQTAELNIDDLGLDLAALDTVDQPGLGSTPDAPTMVAGLDETSRRTMEQAGILEDEATGPAETGAWKVAASDLESTMPPTQVGAADPGATAQMTQLSEPLLDFNLDDPAQDTGVDLDVGTATVPDMGHTETQRISAEDLALPDLEPATMSEVGTKLDLARAYMDMGDPEGARSILEEVLQEGSVNQKQEAQRLIESLPG